MKLYVLLFLCIIGGSFADKKINLEDIERDNLQSEAQTEEENSEPREELKYSSSQNPSPNLQYNAESRIIGGQQLQQIKYVPQPETYTPQNSYSNLQSQRPQQFYGNNYQTEEYQSQKEVPQVSYQPQELSYQSEIPVGNLIQSYQQRIATEKFNQGIGKGEDYSVAAGKQLVYYTNSGIDKSSKSQSQPLLHQLASQAVKNARIPASYTIPSSVPNGHQPQVSYQPQPQIQYIFEPQYILQPTPTYSPKDSQDYAYTNQQTYFPAQGYSGLTYNPPNPVYTQPKQAYTQAYYIPPQLTQYYQEPAYYQQAQVQSGNSLTYPRPESYYVPSKLSQQITASQIPKRPASHGIPQNFAKIPQKPQYTLTLPQIPAQHFKGEVTHLRPVSTGYSHIGSSQNHYSSGPRTLLDSYTPSLIIAARDVERYRERPLHLESGFLPSKASFGHSYNQKRKSE